MEDSVHFGDMLQERDIPRDWVDRTEREPDSVQEHEDGTRHFLKGDEPHAAPEAEWIEENHAWRKGCHSKSAFVLDRDVAGTEVIQS